MSSVPVTGEQGPATQGSEIYGSPNQDLEMEKHLELGKKEIAKLYIHNNFTKDSLNIPNLKTLDCSGCTSLTRLPDLPKSE